MSHERQQCNCSEPVHMRADVSAAWWSLHQRFCPLHSSLTAQTRCTVSHKISMFCAQGSEAESVNGPGQDSGLDTASRHEPSATLPGRVDAPTEAMEGMLCRKQEMENQGKKAASRYRHTQHQCTPQWRMLSSATRTSLYCNVFFFLCTDRGKTCTACLGREVWASIRTIRVRLTASPTTEKFPSASARPPVKSPTTTRRENMSSNWSETQTGPFLQCIAMMSLFLLNNTTFPLSCFPQAGRWKGVPVPSQGWGERWHAHKMSSSNLC